MTTIQLGFSCLPHPIVPSNESLLRNATNTRNGLVEVSKKAIKNAFDNVPFGNLTYGLLGSVPAEMLHIGGTGILKYIFEYLDNLIAGDNDKETFDDLHRHLVIDAQCQSERDFPRMSVCNGIMDGTKMCGSERVGNAFILLCLFHTQLGQKLIATYWTVSINSYKECLNYICPSISGLTNHIRNKRYKIVQQFLANLLLSSNFVSQELMTMDGISQKCTH